METTQTQTAAAARPDSKREAVLAEAMRLVAERGYHGVSIKDVADLVGIRTAAVFYHFPTKADLIATCIARFRDQVSAGMAALDGAPAAIRISGWLELFARDKLAGDLFCLCGMLAAERNGIPETLLSDLAGFHALVVDWLEAAFKDSATPPADARASGEMVFALAEGALIAARMSGDKATFVRAVGPALAALGLPPLSLP